MDWGLPGLLSYISSEESGTTITTITIILVCIYRAIFFHDLYVCVHSPPVSQTSVCHSQLLLPRLFLCLTVFLVFRHANSALTYPRFNPSRSSSDLAGILAPQPYIISNAKLFLRSRPRFRFGIPLFLACMLYCAINPVSGFSNTEERADMPMR